MRKWMIMIGMLLLLEQQVSGEVVSSNGYTSYVFRYRDSVNQKCRLCYDAFTTEVVERENQVDCLDITFCLDSTKYKSLLLELPEVTLTSGPHYSDETALYLPIACKKIKEGTYKITMSIPARYRNRDFRLEFEIIEKDGKEFLSLRAKDILIDDLYTMIKKR